MTTYPTAEIWCCTIDHMKPSEHGGGQDKPEVNRKELCADVLRWLKEPGFCDVMLPQIYFGYQNEHCPFTELLEQWRAFPRDSAVELIPGLAAYKAGQQVVFRVFTSASTKLEAVSVTRFVKDDYSYPSYSEIISSQSFVNTS